MLRIKITRAARIFGRDFRKLASICSSVSVIICG
jgi:hypothetical protein